MIKTFKHKGLECICNTQDMALPGYKLHQLTGSEKDIWSVWVNGNWRVTFYFEEHDAYVIDYRDYH
jgi:toxin HigB-1